jgi:hypothetical protein
MVFTIAILKKGLEHEFWWGTLGQALRRPFSSKGVKYGGTLQKYCSHSSFFLFFCFFCFAFFRLNPHQMKLNLGLQIGGRLLIANDLNQLLWLWLANQLPGGSSHIIFISHFSGTCQTFLCLSPASQLENLFFCLPNCAEMWGQNHVES